MPAAKKVEFATGNFQNVRIFVLIGVWELSLRMGSGGGGLLGDHVQGQGARTWIKKRVKGETWESVANGFHA